LKLDAKLSHKSVSDVIERMANIKQVKFTKLDEATAFENGKLLLDTKVTEKLREEWLIRELVREVQSRRKQMNLKVTDKIKLHLPPEKIYKSWRNIIEKKTGSKIVFGELRGEKTEFEFEDEVYWFGVVK